MLRVARKAIFISDANNFAQGSTIARLIKQILNACGLWNLANWVKTGGKGYHMSEGDGLAYSYSLFNDLPRIRAECKEVLLLNTDGSVTSMYREAASVAVLGIK